MRIRMTSLLAGAVRVVTLAWLAASCQTREREPDAASQAPAASDAASDTSGPLPAALAIAKHAEELMGIPGVVGVYEGESHGRPVLRVMVKERADSTVRRIPKTLEGYPVEIEVSGPIKPMKN